MSTIFKIKTTKQVPAEEPAEDLKPEQPQETPEPAQTPEPESPQKPVEVQKNPVHRKKRRTKRPERISGVLKPEEMTILSEMVRFTKSKRNTIMRALILITKPNDLNLKAKIAEIEAQDARKKK